MTGKATKSSEFDFMCAFLFWAFVVECLKYPLAAR